MTGFPTLLAQIAFTTAYNDTTPTWVDVTPYLLTCSTTRGRADEMSLCDPGELTLTLDNTDGRFDPELTSLYAGYVRPQRRVRVGATANGTYYPIFTGWVESFARTWPEGDVFSVTEVRARDRFKLLAKQKDPTINSRPDEDADVRITALLQHAGIGAADRSINAAALAARTVATTDYDGVYLLEALQEVALSDGGLLFVDGYGLITYQTVKYRQIGGATRARTSQARFGNDATSIGVLEDLDPQVNDSLMMNKVTVTDCNGDVATAEDTTAQGVDGLLEYDIGGTLLLTADAADRVADLLALRKNPTPRYDSISVDVLQQSAADQEKVLARELSDRLTLAVIPPGKTAGTARDQWVERVEHSIDVRGSRWETTFGVSSAGDAAVSIP